MNPKDILIRAAKTAVQAFLGVASVQAITTGDVNTLRTAGAAAVAAAVAVLWNAALAWSSFK